MAMDLSKMTVEDLDQLINDAIRRKQTQPAKAELMAEAFDTASSKKAIAAAIDGIVETQGALSTTQLTRIIRMLLA